MRPPYFALIPACALLAACGPDAVKRGNGSEMRDADVAERWFGWGLNLFAFAWPMACAFVLFAPLGFVRLLGAIALVASTLGIATSLAGLRLASPSRWRALRRDLHRFGAQVRLRLRETR
jgi:hypothetical protein